MMHSRWASFGPGQVGLVIHPYPTPKDGSTPILFWTTVTPEMKSFAQSQGTEAVSSTPEELAAIRKREFDKWGAVVKTTGIKAE